MDYIAVPVDLIKATPNDMLLGEKVRNLFYESTQFGGISEHTNPCIQEKENQ
jgi:hypothetical protein